MSAVKEIAEPTPSLRWKLQPPSEGMGKVLQQAWLVTRTYEWGEVIEQRNEWRDVPMVTE